MFHPAIGRVARHVAPALSLALASCSADTVPTSDAALDATDASRTDARAGLDTGRDGTALPRDDAAVRDARADAGGAGQPGFPIRAAFYYPWYPETWTVGGANVAYHPTLGYYGSAEAAVQQAHLRALEYAGMNAAISEWNPPPHYRNTRLRSLLALTAERGSPLKWAIYYSLEGSSDPTPATLAADLAYVRDNLATQPAYLRVGGRFVVFVWSEGASDNTCALADRWKQASDMLGHAAHIVLKVFSGYRACPSQPDDWHQYGPASAALPVTGYSYTISPGFRRADEATPRLAREPARWQRNIADMVASGARWQLVTTFNEWGEGTATESAQEWSSSSGYGAYLDALHAALAR